MAIYAFLKHISCGESTGGIGDDEMAAYFSFSDAGGNTNEFKVYEADMDKDDSIVFPPTPNAPFGPEHGKHVLTTFEDKILIRTRGVEIDGSDSNIDSEFQDFLNNTIEFDQDNFLWFHQFEITGEWLESLIGNEDLVVDAVINDERITGQGADTGGPTAEIHMEFDMAFRIREDSGRDKRRCVELDFFSANLEQHSRYFVFYRFFYISNDLNPQSLNL